MGDPSAILAARLTAEREELINRIASSIREYPNTGGDATIMAEVDKLVAAERKAGKVEALTSLSKRAPDCRFSTVMRVCGELDGTRAYQSVRDWLLDEARSIETGVPVQYPPEKIERGEEE